MPIFIPYCFLGSFLATVFVLQWWIESSYPWWLFCILGLLGLAGIFRHRVIVAACLGSTLALLAVSLAADRGQFADLHKIAGFKTITVEGAVMGQPDDRGIKTQFVLQTTDVQLTKTGSLIPMSARILVTGRNREEMPAPGDMLEVLGRVMPVDVGSGYERYLKMRDIGMALDMQTMQLMEQGDGWSMARLLWSVKLRFQIHVRRVFPEPMAGLLDGLLTGSNGGLTENVQADFRRTGLSHIVAVSGSNITVILSVLSGLLFFLPFKWRLLPCAIGIILFTLFVGASASVVRAAITGIIGLIALQSENQNNARLATLWTAFAMLCWNPWQLWGDAGFQLSFLAVAGLIELTPILEPWLKRVPDTGGIREALTATLAAQFTAVPWGIALFGAVPLISPLSNVVVAPLIPLAMLTGALGLLIAVIMPPLAMIAGLPAALLLDAIIRAAHVMALVPSASITVPALPSWVMALYYLLLAGSVWLIRRLTSDTATPLRPSLSSSPSASSPVFDR